MEAMCGLLWKRQVLGYQKKTELKLILKTCGLDKIT